MLNIVQSSQSGEEPLEDPLLQCCRKSQTVFPVHREIKQMVETKWETLEAGLRGSRAMPRLYPLPDQEKEQLRSPKVDAVVSAVTEMTTIPVEEGAALKDPPKTRRWKHCSSRPLTSR